MDLPGIYALANQEASLTSRSPAAFVQRQQPDLLPNVIDAANLSAPPPTRCNCGNFGPPMVVVPATKMDILQKRRITTTRPCSPNRLGCPWCRLSAHNAAGGGFQTADPAVYRSVPARPVRSTTATRLKPIWRVETLLAPITHYAVAAPRPLEEDMQDVTCGLVSRAAAANGVSRAHQGQDIDLQLADIATAISTRVQAGLSAEGQAHRGPERTADGGSPLDWVSPSSLFVRCT